ncbi:MAG: MFS transporter [Clostridia bacterium]|nr:MFS transporter [Clostridia bacterium]
MKPGLWKKSKLPIWKRNLYAAWVTQFISMLGFSFGVPVLPYYIQQLGVTSPEMVKLYTGLITAVPAVTLGLMAPVWGMAADRFGKKLMLTRAMAFAFLVLLGLGLATNVNQILVIRFFQGLLTGTVTATYALIAAGTPDDRMSYALGVIASSIFIGNSAGLAIGGFAADIFGYRTSFLIGSGIMLAGLAWVLLAVREVKGAGLTEPLRIFGPKKEKKQQDNGSMKKSGAGKLIPLIATVLPLIFIIRVGRTMIDPYIPIYIQEIRNSLEGSATVSGAIRGISSIATALAGIFITRLGDRYDKIKMSAVLMGAGAVIAVPMFLTGSLVVFTIFYTLVFFAIGGVEPLLNSYASLVVPSEKRGALFGLIAMIGSFGWGVSPAIGSYVSIAFSTKAIYAAFSIFLAIGALACAIVVLRRKAASQNRIIQGQDNHRVQG